MKKQSIALQDGTGYIGYLETLHMLHCVVRIGTIAPWLKVPRLSLLTSIHPILETDLSIPSQGTLS